MAGAEKGTSKKTASPTRRILQAAWKRREPAMWVAIFALVVAVQWPTLKGWYYGAAVTEAPASAVAWRTDLSTALAEARSTNKRVLVDFYASWCPPCIAMKHEVWPDADVARAVNAGYIPVVVDADHDNGLSSRFRVEGIPAILLLDADGRVVKRNDGFLPRDGMLKFLAQAAE